MLELSKLTIKPKLLSQANLTKYKYLVENVHKAQYSLELPSIDVKVVKSNHVNAGIDLHYHLFLVTLGLLQNISKLGLLGVVGHELGHVISLKNQQSKREYHLDQANPASILIRSEYVADEIAVRLVGVEPVLKYLKQSKKILLNQHRNIPLTRYEQKYKHLPAFIYVFLVRLNHPKDWFADDYIAPTLDGRIYKLQSQLKQLQWNRR